LYFVNTSDSISSVPKHSFLDFKFDCEVSR
jgi:hypothetical protein